MFPQATTGGALRVPVIPSTIERAERVARLQRRDSGEALPEDVLGPTA